MLTMTSDFVDMHGFAQMAGITYETMRVYAGRSNVRRREGRVRPGDIPPPDEHFGNSPVWKRSTVERWKASRPGRGAGGAAERERRKWLRNQGIDPS